MFKDKYKNDNQNIAADQPLKSYIKNKMKNEAQKQNNVPTRFFKRTIAFALCAALVAGAIFAHNKLSELRVIKSVFSSEEHSDEKAVRNISYSEVFTLANKHYNNIRVNRYEEEAIIEDAVDIGWGTNSTNGAAPEGAVSKPSSTTSDIKTPTNSENYSQLPGSQNTDDKSQSTDTEEEFSGTNVQVQGVDEADIIKTDGKYIYTLSLKSDTFTITKADKGKLEVISTTTVDDSDFYCGSGAEMYILGDKVAIVSCVYEKLETDLKFSHTEIAKIDIFDCSNKSAPKLVKTFKQDGLIHSSRLVGNKLYLISRCNNLYGKPELDKPETYLPCTYENGEFSAVEPDNLYVSADYNSYGYVLISSYDVSMLSKMDTVAVLGSCETMYMSASSLYICASKHKSEQNYTLISRFAVNDGKIELKSLGSVPGTVLNQFSLDEYNSNLRMVTTVNNYTQKTDTVTYYTASGSVVEDYVSYSLDERTNALYVLDPDLKTIGKIEGLAPDERIYSARFMGNAAYFVTFRETDPLFSVDLSDPKNPKVLGELKIPGFSEYLHPFGDGMLFGFGRDADEKSGATKGLKLSMFDISDPKNVSEASKLTLYDKYSVAESNHKAFLISYDKNLIGFPGQTSFLVYGYSKKDGFVKKAEVEFNNFDQNSRMLYIGDYLYIYTDFCKITSLNMTDFSLVDAVNF